MTATIVGGIGIAHTPSMGMEYDRGMRVGFDPRWAPWYEGTRPVKQWLTELKPTQIIVVYNDHLNHFDFDAYPSLAIGISHTFPQADEGWGPRPLPDLPGDPRFSIHLTEHLIRQSDFDLTVCQELALDHGIYSWLPYLMDTPWQVPITPIAVNMIRHPLPTSRRLRNLGLALRRAVQAFPADERVLVVATGGMSHQISGARFGIANETLDRYFLRTLPHGLDELMAISQEDYMRLGGTEAAELTLWFAMRGALSEQAQAIYDFYTFPQITGCGVIALAEPSALAASR
jgi:protocatechuate 4,5-dioxygenase beta chain